MAFLSLLTLLQSVELLPAPPEVLACAVTGSELFPLSFARILPFGPALLSAFCAFSVSDLRDTPWRTTAADVLERLSFFSSTASTGLTGFISPTTADSTRSLPSLSESSASSA